MLGNPRSIGLIPARSGSKRIPNKNIRLLHGKPLISYTIKAALEAEIFDEVIVSTDSREIAEIAKSYGAHVPELRPSKISQDFSTDFEWVSHTLKSLNETYLKELDFMAILRPTSPLRSATTIIDAVKKLMENSWADSLRALRPVREHPGKMWIIGAHNEAIPFLDQSENFIATHNRPLQTLDPVWVQDASLEVARVQAVLENRSISGRRILSYKMPAFEGLDLNTELDWDFLEYLLHARIIDL